jgi:hypothetical protein
MNYYVYDEEQLRNCFMCGFYSRNTGRIHTFTIWWFEGEEVNELDLLYNFLEQEIALIGYNNLGYDYPKLHYMLVNKKRFLSLPTNKLLDLLYQRTQDIIKADNKWQYTIKKPLIPQLDVYKIWHYDNMARRTSLKSLQVAMRWHNVMDMPHGPHDMVDREQMNSIKVYNDNDILSTDAFFEITKKKGFLDLRRSIYDLYGFDCTNYSDVKIGETINSHVYSKKTGLYYNQYSKKRTKRSIIHVRECIPDSISFKTPVLQDFLDKLRVKSFTLEEDFEYTLHIGDNHYTFAKGGLHSIDSPKIVECEDCKLREADVGGMYPATMIMYKYFPKHLGIEWLDGLSENFNKRNTELKPLVSKLKKTGEKKSILYRNTKAMSDAIKLSLNGGGYGKTKSDFSWMYDPLVTFQVTITGQLSLLMLIEDFELAGIEIISANTDGVVTKCLPEQEEVYQKICSDWEILTMYTLEQTTYDKLIFSHINSYIARITHPYSDIKYKGEFEIDKDYHKDHSKRIVPIALKRYFLDDIPVEQTITNHLYAGDYNGIKNYGIYDFCMTQKVGKQYEVFWGNSKVQRINRYYITPKGKGRSLLKYKKGKPANMVKGSATQIFNVFKEDEYQVYYPYYINEAKKLINKIEPLQISLF